MRPNGMRPTGMRPNGMRLKGYGSRERGLKECGPMACNPLSLSLLTSAGPKCYVSDLKHCSLLPQLTAVKRAEKHVQESIARIKVRIN